MMELIIPLDTQAQCSRFGRPENGRRAGALGYEPVQGKGEHSPPDESRFSCSSLDKDRGNGFI